jgi:uncharacterized protein YbjQ (UPF0145 family)
MSDFGNCRVCDKQITTGFFAAIDDAPSIDDKTICWDCGVKKGIRLPEGANADPELLETIIEQAQRRDDEQERREKLRKNAGSLAKNILLSTTDQIYGREIAANLGIARGGTVRAKNAVSDFGAGIKNVVGGELKAYTRLMADAREQALQRMQIDAVMMEADAVVGVNFSTSMIDVGAAEISAFGTAVKLKEIASDE